MSAQLRKISEAYREYDVLQVVPYKAPEFKGDIPWLGERSCRVGVGGELCGKIFKDTGALSNHLKKDHKELEYERQGGFGGQPNMKRLNEARAWYRTVMDAHNSEYVRRFPQGPSTVPLGPDLTQIPTAPPLTPRKRHKVATTQSTRGSEPDDNSNWLPTTRAEKWELPIYARANKAKKIKKGSINYTKASTMVKDAGGKVPCGGCQNEGNDKSCGFYDDKCDSIQYFTGWDNSEEEV